jgi:redox-sensitive bicupin YhaK (pirin superfamily)
MHTSTANVGHPDRQRGAHPLKKPQRVATGKPTSEEKYFEEGYKPLDNSRYNEYYAARFKEGKMIEIRKSSERGHADHGWLDSRFTFSFADYFDPEHVQFRTLRVLNDDRVAGGAGFPNHRHRDMEIVTYVLEGALEHRDSMGNGSVSKPGDVQYMSAGTGITHSEFNPSKELLHLLQIWMVPEKRGFKPTYDQKNFSAAEKKARLRLVASPDGAQGSVKIRQDNSLYATILDKDDKVKHALRPGRHAYIQVAKGQVKLNGTPLQEGDGAAISEEHIVELTGVDNAEVLLFDLV